MAFYLLLMFFFFEYFRPGLYFPPLAMMRISTILPPLLTVYGFFNNNYLSNGEFLKLKSTGWLLFYLFLILISILTADVTFYAYDFFLQIFGYFLVYFIMVKFIKSIEQLKLLFFLLVIIHLFIIFLNPNIILSPERTYLNHTFMGDGNDFAWSVCIILPFSLFLYLESSKKLKIFYLVILILLLFSIIGTSSRGGTLALGAILIYQWSKSKKKIYGVVLLIVTVFLILLVAPPIYFERMGTLTSYEEEGSAQARLWAWAAGIRMAVDNPILGVGAGHFAVAYGTDYRPPGVGVHEVPSHNAHSIYFKTLGELGFPGIVFLLSIIIFNFFTNEKHQKFVKTQSNNYNMVNRRLLTSLNSSLIGFSVAGTFLSGINYPHLFVLCGIMEVSRKLIDREEFNLVGITPH